MPNPQTLTNSFVMKGTGLHTGAEVRVDVHPAAAARGITFLRDGVAIPALVDYVVDTRRCTTLGRDGVRIHTVEHLLAALLLAGVDSAEVVVDGPELPALDGAAAEWLAAIHAAGIRTQPGEDLRVLRVDAGWLEEGTAQFFLTPAEGLALYAAISIPETVVERMVAGGPLADPAIAAQVARARTYGLDREVRALLDAGLAQGGSLDNAVVLTRDGYLNDHVWPNEPAWHKVLDLLGDLALVGGRIHGRIFAVRAGHSSHVALAATLRRAWLAAMPR